MRIIVTDDRNWYVPDLAEQVINRLLVRYGPGLVIVYDGPLALTARSPKPAASSAWNRRPIQLDGRIWPIPRR